jgi:alpha-glucosidase
MLLLTLRGTPTLYYGDELGMTDVAVPLNAVQDPWEKNEPGLGLGRDPQRTPMQWDTSVYAGFTEHAPWLPVGADYGKYNVASEKVDPTSMLALYRSLIALRRQTPALRGGAYRNVPLGEKILGYERYDGDQRLLIALNFDGEGKLVRLPSWAGSDVLLSTQSVRPTSVSTPFFLQPNEGVVVGKRHGLSKAHDDH